MTEMTKAEKALMELIEKNGGVITPEQVLAEARSKRSPLHPEFEWDDSTAAHQYRLDQARKLIRSIQVKVVVEDKVVVVPYMVRDPDKPAREQGYVSINRLQRDPEAARQAILSEFVQAASAMKRARSLAKALDMEAEVESVETSIEGLKQRARSLPGRAEA